MVGPTDIAAFDNPSGQLLFPDIPVEAYASVFDFGCGCGRIARQLIQARPQPDRYVGIDLNPALIRWCQDQLRPHAPMFEFFHHDVFDPEFNPGDKPHVAPFPVETGAFRLVIAWSVFTHLLQKQAVYYLSEVARILHPDGIFLSTWFLFDKRYFPMMQESQNALFINDIEPNNAVIFDRSWVRDVAAAAGLRIVMQMPPTIRGYQWTLHMVHVHSDRPEVVNPPDDNAPFGIMRPPAHIG
jgi:SAM-dependent methyltransferase